MDSFRDSNRCFIQQNPDFVKEIQKIRDLEKFLSDFGFLTFGRDLVFHGKTVFSLQKIIVSLELTAGNIASCCEHGCMADANTLLRKFRDDAFFYVYVAAFYAHSHDGDVEETAKMKKQIDRWISNEQKDLHIGEVFTSLAKIPEIRRAVGKYGLKEFLDKIGKRLNNYVHSNGVLFYNENLIPDQGEGFLEHLEASVQDIRFIATSFMFLLALCSPFYIMAHDYIDYLDCGDDPPEEAQNWAAPFVVDFFRKNKELIDPGCVRYLAEETGMKLEDE